MLWCNTLRDSDGKKSKSRAEVFSGRVAEWEYGRLAYLAPSRPLSDRVLRNRISLNKTGFGAHGALDVRFARNGGGRDKWWLLRLYQRRDPATGVLVTAIDRITLNGLESGSHCLGYPVRWWVGGGRDRCLLSVVESIRRRACDDGD